MSDILLNTETNDIELVGGDLSLTEGKSAVAQHIKQRLQLLFGEHYLDTRVGVPYREQIIRKNPDLQVADAILKQTIIDTPGVVQLKSFTLGLDSANRIMNVSFSAITTDGVLPTTTVEVP